MSFFGQTMNDLCAVFLGLIVKENLLLDMIRKYHPETLNA